MASARVFTASFNDHSHLMKRAGEWRLVNVLWHQPVSASSAPDADKGAVEQALKDLVTALAASNRSRLQALVHPLVVWRHLVPSAPGRRVIFDENIDTMLVAMAGGQDLEDQATGLRARGARRRPRHRVGEGDAGSDANVPAPRAAGRTVAGRQRDRLPARAAGARSNRRQSDDDRPAQYQGELLVAERSAPLCRTERSDNCAT